MNSSLKTNVIPLSQNRIKSKKIHASASKLIPGGVNSPVRSFNHIGIPPMIVEEGKGAEIIDVDGNIFLDFCGSWGALIHGHAHPQIVSVAQKRIAKGSTFGIATEIEEKLARKVVSLLPHVEKIRFVSSGTEATMSAIRLGRAFTGRNKILKFEGHYHGHSDALLVKGGSGLIEMAPEASSKGVPSDVVKDTLVVPFNDFKSVTEALAKGDVALVIVEPIAANMGVVLPVNGFLEHIKKECEKKGTLLIFDEVITGFRVGLKGAAGLYDIKPDLSCFGKIIGGGFPCAAFGGRKEIMDLLAPIGPVYQAGTLSGNPVAMTAGLKALELLETPQFYEDLEKKGAYLIDPISEYIEKANLNVTVKRIGSMFTIFFGTKKMESFQVLDTSLFREFFCYLFEKGIYFSPSQYEANFISSEHTYEQLGYARGAILEFLSGKSFL